MKTIRFGIIGCGLMGREFASAAARWFHLDDLGVRPEIVAVCSRSEASIGWFTRNVPTVRRATTDYRELLAAPDVDAAYIAVPHDLHAEMYVAALRAGKHLLGEKPFGIDKSANASILAEAARRPDLLVRSTSQYPFFPGAQRIAAMAGEGRFGRIMEVECGLLHSSDLDPDKPINWKRTIARNGEYGCMGDLGLHAVHMPLRLGLRPQNVRAVLSNIMPDRPDATGRRVPCETWDNAVLLCETSDGESSFPMIVRMHRIAPGESNTWYVTIRGTRASASFSTKFPRTLEVLEYAPGGRQVWGREDLGYEPIYPAVTARPFEFGFGDSILQMIAAYCDELARGVGSDVPFRCATPEETRWSHEIFTAAVTSQREGRTVAVA